MDLPVRGMRFGFLPARKVELKRAGLEHIRFHDLRHTFGTIAVQAFR